MTFPEAYELKGYAAFKEHPDAKNWGWNMAYLTHKRLYRFFVDYKLRIPDGRDVNEWKAEKLVTEMGRITPDMKELMAYSSELAHKKDALEYWFKNLPSAVQNTEP